ncbi:MAG: lipopolysaccharide heptosyltransferase RfaC [Mixta calida]|uniref:Lipopolysaccharide heptosyltransferase 1 n=2 Tax=Mixta calida TaxID=665913 RepID=A0ABN5HIY4_9GAMM|nr:MULTISPECIES: lipopolysaccharide heptosyltransferase RfaC [Mixta]AIX75297.1 ADP-heptose--LPS heptosyltransferase [Pantoea sp. PSNIH2]MBS6057845.1 lipopolysaccharide heptosyltransferase RfaC [Pantoea sp.]POU44348.1 lipopolysaccharide heptosyltransferase RfaC [Pantoea sp. PSNIH5]POU63228.1 lipopolysaccharide heptosyltransferase RfaC [Pantoea sp. PSNIH4]POY66782.1 lipopolysaccharide heptosyltransferase RfaC [Pantoea sp. PSNIH3]HCW47823.1 lipopolysaccharide heptosyltransferase RfaC [Erwiniacea
MKVLIVKTSSMGDVLHTLPALTDAMRAIPTIRFDWVVEENFAQIPSWHPAVDRVLPVAIRRWRKHWFGSQQREERLRFKQALQSREYDVVIDAQGLIKSAALVTRLAKGVKHGQDSRSAREPFASWWYDKRHEINKQQHAVERTRELFAKSLGYQKPQTQGDYAIASHFLARPPADAGRYLVFLHATTRDNKHWPESHWRELISLLEPGGLRIKLPWGAEHEHQRAQRLAAGFTHVDVLPKLTLEQVAQTLAGAKAVVSVDTGLSHLTAALDRPNITLYGPTDPGLIGGYGLNQQALRASEKGDMATISAAQVNAVLQLLLSTEA